MCYNGSMNKPTSVIPFTQENRKDALSSTGKILLDFRADWCGPCNRLTPILEELAAERPDLHVYSVDVDNFPDVAAQFQITSIPALFLLEGGKLVGQSLGLTDKATLVRNLNLGPVPPPAPPTPRIEAFRMHLKPGCEAEYERRHAQLWPEMKALLKGAGVSDYRIFLDRETGNLFAIQTVSGGQGSQDLGANPVCQKWWDYMADLMDVNPDNSPVSVPLEQVFLLQ